jgi:protein gp37
MATDSKIEWTDSTLNPWLGCTKISPACQNCYAEALMDKRYHRVKWGNHPRSRTSLANRLKPLTWNRNAPAFFAKHGHRQRVFSGSLCDWLDNQVDQLWREDFIEVIEATPNLDWLLLTKRIDNFPKLVPRWWQDGCPPNVWIGATCEDQEHYDRHWQTLRKIQSVVRFISYEPALGPLRFDYSQWLAGPGAQLPDWIISGGESPQGKPARISNPTWYRAIHTQCAMNDIAYFHKQFGNYESNPAVFELGFSIDRVKRVDPPSNGKGGALLDGRLYRELPTPRAATWRSAA